MSNDAFGLLPASSFRIVTGATAGDTTLRQARWYFRDDTIAVPRDGVDGPPLVWIGAPQMLRGAVLSRDGTTLNGAPLRLAPKIPLNRSYWNADSTAYLADRPLTVRGTAHDDAFELRVAWPDDFVLTHPLAQRAVDGTALALRTLMREEPRAGAQSPFAAWTLWQREPASDWSGRPLLALMVNGAQGDDDEAHAGHFAVVTGRVRPDGRIGDWLVNNFYTLDSESEKGILAAPVPLDAYLSDLNSGQSWYRPSYLLVLVLREERAATLVQSALNRAFARFYRHEIVYYHPDANCTSISVDALRELGWDVPARGASGRALAWLGLPLMILRERSLAKAKASFDYLCTDQTRLLPAVAMEEAYASVRTIVAGAAAQGALASMLREDVDTIAFLRIPQFPSSRAFGDAPVVTLREYRARVPRDPALVQRVPVPARVLPEELREDAAKPPLHESDIAVRVWGAIVLCLAVLATASL